MKSVPKAKWLSLLLILAYSSVPAQAPQHAHWPQWRGPFFNGMARGDAPTNWSDTRNIKWKTDIPGKGHSTPVVWGDRIFLTTAIPTGKAAATPMPTPSDVGGQGRRSRGAGGDTSPQPEHRFEVLCLVASLEKSFGKKPRKLPHLTKAIIEFMGALPRTRRLPTGNTSMRSLDRAVFMLTTSTES